MLQGAGSSGENSHTAPLKITHYPRESSLIKPPRDQFSPGNSRRSRCSAGSWNAPDLPLFFPLLQSIFLSEPHVAQNSSGRGGFQRATPPARPPLYRGHSPKGSVKRITAWYRRFESGLAPPAPARERRPRPWRCHHHRRHYKQAQPGPPAAGRARPAPARRARAGAARIWGKTQPKNKGQGRRGRKRRCGLFFFQTFYLHGSWRSSPFCPQRTTPRRNWRGLATSATRGKAESTVRKRGCRVPAPQIWRFAQA